jgi:molecular chaperone DnaK (HSP70)
MARPVIGIDLGTTYSSVSRLRHYGPELIPDGDKIAIPSIVAFQDGEWQVGRLAADRAWKYPTTTVYDTKLMLGCSFDMPAIQAAKNSWPFPVVRGSDGKIVIEIQEGNQRCPYSPCQLSAKILTKLKELAESTMPDKVTDAVISVPAYFNDSQRADTMEAATIAGLNVLRLLNEPSAGALAYGFEEDLAGKKTVLVFDFGGGTLDLSLVELDGDRLSVQAVSGDTHLGGRDFDEVLMRLSLERFDPTGGTTVETITKEECHVLRSACQQAKCNLSESERTEVFIRAFHGRHFEVNLSRNDFNLRCGHLLARIRPLLEEVLEFGGITAAAVDEIITIGGSTSIPAVRLAIRDFFGKEPFDGVSPLEAVAKGAAIMAGKIKGKTSIPRIRDLEFRDICPLSIGVDLVGERMSVVIPAGTPLPAIRTAKFGTAIHDQADGRFQVFEGPWSMTKRNRLLGSFQVQGIPPEEAGKEQVEITFSLDSDRILTVTAVIPSQGTTTSSLTVRKTGCLLGTKAIMRIQTQSENEKATDAREFDEAGRRSWLVLLHANLARFFTSTPEDENDRRDFGKMVSQQKRTQLLEFVRGKIQDLDGAAPSREEMTSISEHLCTQLCRYLDDRKRPIPSWLQATDPK